MKYRLIEPHPARLSEHAGRIAAIERSGRFANFGPVNAALEAGLRRDLFGGVGHLTTAVNGTLALMLALRATIDMRKVRPERVRVIMPSFTFAATGQAVLWCGMKFAYCDVDPGTWALDISKLDAAIRAEKRKGFFPLVLLCPTFGNAVRLADYEALCDRHGAALVCDAAASLGSSVGGRPFGQGCAGPVVFSTHVTKAFAGYEGAVVYSSNRDVVAKVRRMSDYGFDRRRAAALIGLNAKMHELSALACLLKLPDLRASLDRRRAIGDRYRAQLDGVVHQDTSAGLPSYAFYPVCLSKTGIRTALVAACAAAGLEVGKYFSPPLHRNGIFSRAASLPVTDRLSRRVINLPIHEGLSDRDVDAIAAIVNRHHRRLG